MSSTSALKPLAYVATGFVAAFMVTDAMKGTVKSVCRLADLALNCYHDFLASREDGHSHCTFRGALINNPNGVHTALLNPIKDVINKHDHNQTNLTKQVVALKNIIQTILHSLRQQQTSPSSTTHLQHYPKELPDCQRDALEKHIQLLNRCTENNVEKTDIIEWEKEQLIQNYFRAYGNASESILKKITEAADILEPQSGDHEPLEDKITNLETIVDWCTLEGDVYPPQQGKFKDLLDEVTKISNITEKETLLRLKEKYTNSKVFQKDIPEWFSNSWGTAQKNHPILKMIHYPNAPRITFVFRAFVLLAASYCLYKHEHPVTVFNKLRTTDLSAIASNLRH